MRSITIVSSWALLVVAVSGFPEPTEHYNRFAPRQSGITWQSCYGTNIQCGHFEVPLDYANPAAGKASLAVIRYLATASPRLGTLFTNPGGPGGSGVQYIAGGSGKSISNLSGGHYDVVSWDPRGVNNTVPRVDCFASASEQAVFWEGAIPYIGVEARGNFTDKADLDYFYSQVDKTDQKLTALHARCLAKNGDVLKYVGSVAAVRDMVALSDYLEKPGAKINFWGFSYGTVIGSYFVNMFPDRVGRVILDGVVNPSVWSQLPPHLTWGDWIQSVDEALEGFALACATAGTGCALATASTTPPDILKFVTNLIDKAYDYKKAGLIAGYSAGYMRAYIANELYRPRGWVQLAETLLEYDAEISAGLAGKATTNRARHAPPNYPIEEQFADATIEKRATALKDFSYQAIMCADAIDNTAVTTKDVFDEVVRVSRQVSPTFGARWGIFRLGCHRWSSRAVERFQGPWNHVLANPILVIGNEADPITPYASAKFVADQLGDSATLVEQDDYGHCSLAMHSDCTATITTNYFVKGVLPTADQFCGTDAILFPGAGITKTTLKTSNGSYPDDGQGDSGSRPSSPSRIQSLEKEKKTLLSVAYSMAAAVALLFIGLVVQFFKSRSNTRGLYAKLGMPQFAQGGSKSGKEYSYDSSYSYAYDPPGKTSH